MRNPWLPTILLLTSVSLPFCSRDVYPHKAFAEIENSQGKRVGSVVIQQVQDSVRFSLYIDGLPKGTYGFAVHDFGECDPPNFINAGSPFPANENLGTVSKMPALSQALGELHVEEGVHAQKGIITGEVTLKEGYTSLFHPGGTSVVIYTVPTDTQGLIVSEKRVACGVIFPSTGGNNLPQSLPEGELEDANTPRYMDIPGEIHRQPK